NPGTFWTHVEYPLLLPLAEAWVYAWVGGWDERLVAVTSVLFYAAGVGILWGAGSRLSRESWVGPVAAVLLACIPKLTLGFGGVAGGWADFPISVFYLAAAVYLEDALESGRVTPYALVGVLLMCLAWLKTEGAILCACVSLVAAIGGWRRSRSL